MHTVATHLNPGLVFLSVSGILVASFVSLDFIQRSRWVSGWNRRLWIAAGGIILGLGIWSMHFVGMLALEMAMPVSYNAPLVALSLLAAVLGAGVALAVVARAQSSTRALVSAAAFMGLAIASMHYLGMASMEMAARIHWSFPLVALSLAIGFGASLFALWMVRRIREADSQMALGWRIAAACALGLGIAGLHYVGMAAATFEPTMRTMAAGNALDGTSLVVLLGLAAALTLAVLLLGSLADQRRAALATDLALVFEHARALGRSPDARKRTLEAVLELAGADLVVLVERDAGGALAVTGTAGQADVDLDAIARLPQVETTAAEVSSIFLADLEGAGGTAAPGARSALFTSLSLGGDPTAVVGVLWSERRGALGDRLESLLGLIVAEAAVAIDRGDLLTRLDYLARRDDLTGLVNRRVLRKEIDAALSRARAGEGPLSVVMLDIDNFKSHNDSFGHQAGDRLLKTAGTAWERTLREVDTIARYGGDEFLAILPGCGPEAALSSAERLRTAVPTGVTCSAGVATWEPGESAAQLIGRADDRLYEAKQAGRNRVCSEARRPDPRPQLAHD